MKSKQEHPNTETIPIWCDGCDQQGEIIVRSSEEPVFVICRNCGHETAEVWCPKCGIGGEYIRNASERPISWICPECKSNYKLPENFYKNPVSLKVGIKSIPSANQKFLPEPSKGDIWFLVFTGTTFLSIGLFILINNRAQIGTALVIIGVLFFAFILRIIRII